MIVSKVLFDNFKKLLYNIYVIRKKKLSYDYLPSRKPQYGRDRRYMGLLVELSSKLLDRVWTYKCYLKFYKKYYIIYM